MTEFVDASGKPLTGLALHNAKRKAEKAAAEAASTANANPAEPAPAAKTTSGKPKLDETPAAAPADAAPVDTGPTDYSAIRDAILQHDAGFGEQNVKTETSTQYLTRLLKSVLDVPDEVLPWSDDKGGFAALPDGANAWIDAATKAFKNSKPMPTNLDGFVDGYVGSGGVKKEKKAKGEKAPRVKKVKERKIRPEGSVKKLKKYLIEHPAATVKDLLAYVDTWTFAEGQERPALATLQIVHTLMGEVVDMIKAAGHWKD